MGVNKVVFLKGPRFGASGHVHRVDLAKLTAEVEFSFLGHPCLFECDWDEIGYAPSDGIPPEELCGAFPVLSAQDAERILGVTRELCRNPRPLTSVYVMGDLPTFCDPHEGKIADLCVSQGLLRTFPYRYLIPLEPRPQEAVTVSFSIPNDPRQILVAWSGPLPFYPTGPKLLDTSH